MKPRVLSDEEESPRNLDRDWYEKLQSLLPPVSIRPLQLGYDPIPYASAGLWQGGLAGCTSLLFNIIGSVMWPAINGQQQHALRLIQVYLTFPLGESALQLDSGMLLALGCLMYLAIGMIYGMLFVLVISYFLPHAGIGSRLLVCSVLAVVVWISNFYGILLWLQPLLLGGRWIIELVPWWVAALTHLAFGWTMAIIYPLGTTSASRDQLVVEH